MNKEQVSVWCREHRWTKPRQIEDIWVAFPPNGVIETPIPDSRPSSSDFKFFDAVYLLYTLILLIIVLAVGVAATCITPYFWLAMLKSK
ncbi:MAG: hypothetical protein ACFB4I_16590 [Cyanophyceae cyanobacterium]